MKTKKVIPANSAEIIAFADIQKRAAQQKTSPVLKPVAALSDLQVVLRLLNSTSKK